MKVSEFECVVSEFCMVNKVFECDDMCVGVFEGCVKALMMENVELKM